MKHFYSNLDNGNDRFISKSKFKTTMKKITFLLFFFAIILFSQNSFSQTAGTFTSATNPVGTVGATTDDGDYRFIIDIDYDSDGDIDFIAYDGDSYDFYINNGSGVFSKIVPNVTLPLKNGSEYLVADFDNDGDDDIFAPTGYFTNNGSGIFTSATNPVATAGASPSTDDYRFIIDIDYDSDGDIDFIAYEGSLISYDGDYNFYSNNGSGVFSKVVPNITLPLKNASEYLIADFDNDGDDDLFSPTVYLTQDYAPPVLSSFAPSDNATGVDVNTNIVLNFNEAITSAGLGTITIFKTSDNSTVESIAGNDAKVTGVATSTITINPATTLDANTEYYIQVGKAAFYNTYGMTYNRLNSVNKTSMSFTTGTSNAAPTATAPSAPTVAEDETNVVLANDIQVVDVDGDDQTLTFTITGGTLTTGTTGITFGGSGNGSTSFTAAGTLANINAALDAATFTPTANLNGTNAGTISFTTNDGTDTSSAASVSFDISEVNDEPTLTATGNNPTYTEDGSVAVVFIGASASTVESGQTLSAFTMNLTNVNDGSSEKLNLDGTAITLTNGTSGTTATNSLSYSVSVSGTTVTLSLSGGTLSSVGLQSLINAISYQNNSNTPNTSNRVVTITSLTDSGSNIGSNDNIAVLSIASTVTVQANNDAPTLTSFASVVETTNQNTEIEITLAELKAQGNETDVDGTIDAFIVKALSSGTLNIGADSGSATSFNATTNKTIDASNNAYWTPANNLIGSQNSFTTTVQDNNSAESTGAVQVRVMVNDVTKPEISSISISGSPAVTATSITFVVEFNESVVNVSVDDFSLTKVNTANGTIASVSASSGTSMNVTVNGISGAGTLRLDLNASTNIADVSANTPPATYNLGAVHTVDLVNPTLNSSVPANDANSISTSANITLTFSENIEFGTGNIQIIDLDDGSSTVTIDVASPGAQVSISTNTLTLNPTSDLEEYTNYAIQLASTSIDDSNGNSYAGIVANTILNFKTLAKIATVTTQSISSITTTTATANGSIPDLGSPNPTQHGVCWNTSGTPTVADSKTEEGAITATGAFDSDITGLISGTTYYVRAYATNSAGTSYGSQVSFTTVNKPTITTTPELTVAYDKPYAYSIVATTEGELETIISAPTVPAWLTASADGQNQASSFGDIPEGVSISGVAGDDEGNIYAITNNGTTIYKITPDGNTTLWRNDLISGQVYALHIANGYLYIPRYGNSSQSITRLPLDNSSAIEETIASIAGGALSLTDKDGWIYAADWNSATISRINEDSKAVELLLDSSDGVPSGGPFGLTFDQDDNLYIATWSKKSILKYDGSSITTVLSGLPNNVSSIRQDKRGNFYLSMSSGGVRKYTQDFSSYEDVSLLTNDNIWSLSFTSSGALVYAKFGTNEVYRLQTGAILSGTPAKSDLGDHSVVIRATNDAGYVEQAFTITVIDTIKPIVSVFSPLDNATAVNLKPKLSVSFDEEINLASTGTFSLISEESILKTYDLSVLEDKNAIIQSADNKTISIEITESLPVNSLISIEISSGFVKDVSNNGNSEITVASSSWNFTTINTPTVATAAITIFGATTATMGGEVTADGGASISERGVVYSETATNSNPEIGGTGVIKFAESLGTGTGVFDESITGLTEGTSYSVKAYAINSAGTFYGSAVVFKTHAIPVVTASQTFNVNENAEINASVGTVLATDDDAGTTFSSWTITAGNEDAIFVIHESTGAITIADNTNLDFETTTTYTLSVTVGDGVNTSSVQTVSINVTDINDQLPVITASQTFNMDENAVNNTSVGTALATDADSGTTFSNWMITGGNTDAIFAIDSGTGEITLVDNTNLDFESTTGYILSISVSDGTNTSAVEDVVITIMDVNEAPNTIQLSNLTIAENLTVGSEIGILTASDEDANQTFTFTMAENENFEIVGDKLITKLSLDFEAQNSYSVEITVADQGDLSYLKNFTIQITDENDSPTAIQLSNATIAENLAIGTEVGTLTATDEDASQMFTYTIVENENFDLIENKLVSKAVFNYVVEDSYSVEITVTDQGGLSFKQNFTIEVLNSNEAPTAILLSNLTIAENAAVGTEVGVLTTTDPDINQIFTYKLAENSYFDIDGDKIVSKASFNAEDHISYSIKVTVTDQGGLSFDERFTINIEDVNEVPEFLSEPILEARVGEEYTYTIKYQDVDGDKCNLSALEMSSWLSLVDYANGTGTLSGIPTESDVFNVSLELSDGQLSASQEFEIKVAITTGIDAVFTAAKVSIYPNPTADELHIDLSDFANREFSIFLCDMTGSQVFKEQCKTIGGEAKIHKSIQQLQSGLYLLVIESEGLRKAFKIVKQ
ncbi:hypothetical protein BZG02_09150 [Labilibaculum filiforme]|uniref:Cadherin domain-containing protein n=1 Tax=Labilibaculum filiforme TaxID=1940526 RepID=A0A2N3HZN6_9BACT|nr:cadherin domain-containing protein [Labilibaculum filiforme]PKQ63530.1 hypothetical protein BZG02_09150 [Labilibaculum filiforme]